MLSMTTVGRNDPCPCGSGKKYKKCCLDLRETAPNRQFMAQVPGTLYQKNLALLAATKEIFHLEKPWDQVKAGMTDARIRAFYQFIAALWPLYTPIHETIPALESNLRALYLGENLPELMLSHVFRFSLYADQIILTNPFHNPNLIREQYSPLVHPEQWRMETLRVVYQLGMLTPWIVAGIVILMPDPGDFNRPLLMETARMAFARLKNDPITEEDVEDMSTKDRVFREFYLMPPENFAAQLRETNPGISDEEIAKVLEYVKRVRKEDPLLLDTTWDKLPGQMTSVKVGANLEMGLLICQTIGAFPYTNVKFRWREILSVGKELDAKSQVWSPLTHAFQQLNFKFLNNVDSNFVVEMRKEGRLEGFRAYMRKIWNTVGGDIDLSKSEKLALDFRDELSGEYDKAKSEWDAIDRDLMKWAVPAIAGVVGAVGGFATGQLALSLPSAGFVVQGVNELIQAQMKRKEFRKKTPMSVFIDLNEKRS